MKQENNLWSRRRFLGSTVAGAAGIIALPYITSCSSKTSNDVIKMGFIGAGQQAMSLLNSFIRLPNVEVVAGCDVYGIKRTRFERRVNKFYQEAGKKVKVETYEKYEDLLARSDIKAVVIAIPDHSHAMVAIAACKAGKDVYLEKPMTFTIKEGQTLRKVVRDNKRILAVGSQQRSDAGFQHACKMARDGAIGKISLVNAYVGAPPTPYNLPEEPIPADLNWDRWLGPLNVPIHYNHELNPPISLDPEINEKMWGAWRWYKEMGGGFTTDWGAHMFDIAQWGLGMDKSGPVEASPIGDGTEYMSFKYASGTIMTSEPFNDKKTKGVKFHGETGWIEVARGYYNASDPKLFPVTKADSGENYEEKPSHQANFINSVITREDPIVPVEIGHRSCTVCTLGNIACEMKKTIRWDPSTETFLDKIEGDTRRLIEYPYRSPWKLV